METLIILGVIAVAIAVALKTLARSRTKTGTGKTSEDPDFSSKWPYKKRKTLLTVHEQPLYFALRDALPEHLIFAQVQLSQILSVEKGSNFGTWYGRISRMSIDFVVCNKSTEIIALIELDDSSHNASDRQKADQKKDKACADAGLTIIRWKQIPDRNEIRKALGLSREQPRRTP